MNDLFMAGNFMARGTTASRPKNSAARRRASDSTTPARQPHEMLYGLDIKPARWFASMPKGFLAKFRKIRDSPHLNKVERAKAILPLLIEITCQSKNLEERQLAGGTIKFIISHLESGLWQEEFPNARRKLP
jgi:hypothetical protein